MELHYGLMSGNSARSIFCLFEAKVVWTHTLVNMREGENRRAGYLALNPMGKIPSFTDGDLHLWESNAINWYVAETHPDARLIPERPEGRARVQRWLYFQTGHVTPACIQIFRATNQFVQAMWGTKFDAAALEAGNRELARYLPVLESALDGKEWLEDDFSLADIAFVPHFVMIAMGGFDFSPYKNVKDWYERLTERQAWKDTHQLVFAPVVSKGV